MRAEKYLADVRRTMAAFRRRMDELERIDSMVNSVTQALELRESCRTPMACDRMGDNVVALMEARERCVAALEEAVAKREEALGYLDELEDERHADVLHRRYLMGMGWQAVADDMGYTYHHVHRLHSEAVERLQRVLDKSIHGEGVSTKSIHNDTK